jgi:hypothetical protein
VIIPAVVQVVFRVTNGALQFQAAATVRRSARLLWQETRTAREADSRSWEQLLVLTIIKHENYGLNGSVMLDKLVCVVFSHSMNQGWTFSPARKSCQQIGLLY